MILKFGPLPKKLLETSYRDWTPAEAELARQHFLEPLLPKPGYEEMSVNQAAIFLDSLTVLPPEMEWLKSQALRYFELHRDPNSSTPMQELFKKLRTEQAAKEAAEAEAAASATLLASAPQTSPVTPPAG